MRALLTVWFQDNGIVEIRCSYLSHVSPIFVNAGRNRTCQKVLEKLNNIESLCQGTPKNVFYFIVLNGLNLSFSVIVNMKRTSSNKRACEFYDQVAIVMGQMSVQQLRVWK